MSIRHHERMRQKLGRASRAVPWVLAASLAAACTSTGGDPGETGEGDAGVDDAGGTVDARPTPGEDAAATDGGGTSEAGDAGPDGAADAGPPACVKDGGVCPVGSACASEADCEGLCTAGVCAVPTHTDGKVSPSLGETDVDCGGPTAPKKCADDKTCAADADCGSGACSAANKCVAGSSCKGSANGPSGIETCGTGELGAAGAVNESCCTSLPLPTRKTRRLDRYSITGGRIRAFIDAIAAANAGVPDIRAYAKTYAAANPTSQLGTVLADYPGLLDVLPDHGGPTTPIPLPVHLGAFPLDPINSLDGCFVGPGAYGHATYWQPKADLQPFGVGNNGDRRYSRDELDKKPVNCMMSLMLATFCAWDGGELARTADYHEIWGRRPVALGATTVYIPWTTIQPIGDFNWRNGHGDACPFPWPNCINPQPSHYTFPAANYNPAQDDTPSIGAPGRFPLDVTAITSANGAGWYDVGGNLMEVAWPVGAVNPGRNAVTDVCDVSAGPGPGETPCTRRGQPGVLRYAGALPHVALVGYSFEGHSRRSEAYLASLDGAESRIGAGDLKPVSFQYGKVGGRCARPAPP